MCFCVIVHEKNCNFVLKSVSAFMSHNLEIINMGTYINKGNLAFKKILRSNYVDKTSFIADAAIDQIHRKEYEGKVLEYTDNLLLVGINYDKESKKHTCIIEKY